jgi:DNA-directed RNA polymerase subunit RPC12/RpoP
MMLKIKCPKCDVEGSLSLIEPNYHGPYKCWKCRALFTLDIEKNVVKSCEPLSQEEFEQQQQMEFLKAKLRKR